MNPFASSPVAASIRDLTRDPITAPEAPTPPSPFTLAAALDYPCPKHGCPDIAPHILAEHEAQIARNAPTVTVTIAIHPTRNALQILTNDPTALDLLNTLRPGFTVEANW